MSDTSYEELRQAVLRLIAEARLADLGLWTDLVEAAFQPAAPKAEVSKIAARLGAARAEQTAPIESLVREFSLVRSGVEASASGVESVAEIRKTVSANLETSLASAVRAYSEVRIREAMRDRVTGLPHRAAFETCLAEEMERAKRYHRKFSLILFDIDQFKRINDQKGHPEGDRVLAEVGRVLSQTLRRTDRVFRYGGDEFAALCLESGEHGVERILQRVEAGLGDLRISAGVATFPSEATDGDALVTLADRRMYECKRAHQGE